MNPQDSDRTDRPNRRDVLRATGAGIAGVGLLGTAGTVAAQTNFELIDAATIGSSTGTTIDIQLMNQTGERPPQEVHDHAEDAFGNLLDYAYDLDGVYLTSYEHDATMGYEPSLNHLDNIISDHFSDGNDRVKVWDCGEVQEWPDGPGVNNEENFINVSDPAVTSSSIYPPVTGFGGDDGLGHNNLHVRVEVASVALGRITKAAFMPLLRIRDLGEWDDSSFNLPRYQTDYHYGLGLAYETDDPWWTDPVYEPSVMGWLTQPDNSMNNGQCTTTEPDDWTNGSQYLTDVTLCSGDHVDRAIDYFD